MLSQEFLKDIDELNDFAQLLINIVKEIDSVQYFENKIRLQHRFQESLSTLEKLLRIANSKKVEIIALIEYYEESLELTSYFGNRCYTSSLFSGNEKEAADRMLYFIQVVYNVLISIKEEGEKGLSQKAKDLLKELKYEKENGLKYLYMKSLDFYKKVYKNDAEKLALVSTKINLTERQKQQRVKKARFLSEEWLDAMLDLMNY